MGKKYIFLIWLFSFWAGGLWAQLDVSAELDSTSILIGDQLQLQIFVEQAPGAEVQHIGLDVIEKDGHIEIVGAKEPDTIPTEQNVLIRHSLVLTSFDSGYHYIPAIPITYTAGGRTDTVFTNQLALAVTNPFVSDTTALQPIKDIIREPFSFRDALPYLAGMLALAVTAYLVYHFFFRKDPDIRSIRPVSLLPAHVVARQKLQQLHQEKLWQQGQIKPYYSRLTFIIREYLQRGLGISALEETTDRILLAVQKTDLEKELQNDLQSLLVTADLVKFAKATPAEASHLAFIRKAENFVDSTSVLDQTVVPEVETVEGEVTTAYQVYESAVGKEELISLPLINEYNLASFWSRFFAYLLDTLFISMLFLLFLVPAVLLTGARVDPAGLSSPQTVLLGFSLFSLQLIYFTVLEFRYGATFGKMILGVQVVNQKGKFLNLGGAFLRALVKSTLSMPLYLGYLFFFFTKKRQTLHDKIAGAFVVKKSGIGLIEN